jgi:hypothetical protein
MEELNRLICTPIFRIKFKLFSEIKVRYMGNHQQPVFRAITFYFHVDLIDLTITLVITVKYFVVISCIKQR